jgi:protein phosphatase
MSPSETSKREGLLEHPAEPFSYCRTNGVSQVVVEQKHMGSRAILIVCRNEEAPRQRFGVLEAENGICYTRRGRLFESAALGRELSLPFEPRWIGPNSGSTSTPIGCASIAH